MAGFLSNSKRLFNMITPVAVNTSVAELTILGTVNGVQAIAANTLAVGNELMFRGKGIFSASGATTKIFKVKIGATVFTFGTYTASGALTNRPFRIDLVATVQTIGATGSIWGVGELLLHEVAGAAPLSVTVTATTAPAIDTTASNTIDCTCTEGNSAATDSVTLQEFSVELYQ